MYAERWRSMLARRHLTTYPLDAAIACVVGIATFAPLIASSSARVTPLGVLLNLGTVVPLVWRRRSPVPVALAVGLFSAAVGGYPHPGQFLQYGGLVAVYTLADRGRRWQRGIVLAVLVVTVPAGAVLKGNSLQEFLFSLLLPLAAYLFGVVARIRRAEAANLAERVERAEHERGLELARAAAEERARIARDMHDILAHAVSLMVVQAEAGPVVVWNSPERAERAFDAIAEAGRDAMGQLRRMLSMLADDTSSSEGRVPPPSVARLGDLIDQVRRTGLPVEESGSGRIRPLQPDADVAGYRIVQEALTNTVKHAAATRATVRLDWRDDELMITVRDNGSAGETARRGLGTGNGLTGLRERASASGGHAEAGPAPGGGFVVTAHLPYAAVGARS